KLYLPLILLIIVIFEGVAINLLPTALILTDYLIIAHWVLVFLVYIAIYYDTESTYYSVLYAILFGLLIDILYTGILGVYMFSYATVIYVIHGLQKLLQRNFFVLLLLGFTAIVSADFLIYAMYYVVGITEMAGQDYLMQRLVPTILANFLFLLILFPIIKKSITRWGDEQLSKGS